MLGGGDTNRVGVRKKRKKEMGTGSRARGLVVKTLLLIGGAVLLKRLTKSTTRWDHARIVGNSLTGQKVPTTDIPLLVAHPPISSILNHITFSAI
jgi:hypothetical protein